MSELNQEMIQALLRVPAIWAHKHEADEKEMDFDPDFADVCAICSDRMGWAIRLGRTCPNHPGVYFQPAKDGKPAYCDGCAAEKEGGLIQ